MWEHFLLMNSNQIAAMSYESEDFSNSWYHRFAKHPYYGRYGLNSGVMLMNLTRMRQFDWIAKLEPTLIKYRSKIVWGDQDIINIIFHSNEGTLMFINSEVILFYLNSLFREIIFVWLQLELSPGPLYLQFSMQTCRNRWYQDYSWKSWCLSQ